MKALALTLSLIQSLVLVVQAHAGCGFMPEHFFEGIMDNPNYDEETRQNANFTLQHTRQLRDSRSAVEGWDPADDDGDYPEEESPDDIAILQAELANYETAEAIPADPNSTETTNSTGTITRRRRRSLYRRQSGSLMRFIHNDNMDCDREKVGPLVRDETSGPALDTAINNVYDGFDYVDSLYRGRYGRNGIDDHGEPFRARVHYCTNYNNAFWDGIGMFFGDGDGITTYKYAFPANQDVVSCSVLTISSIDMEDTKN